MNGSKRKFQNANLSDQNNDNFNGNNNPAEASHPPSGSTSSDGGQRREDIQPDKETMENKSTKSFAQTFAFLKTTDMYKLPPKPTPITPLEVPKSTNSIIVNSRQRGNPILKHIRNVPWEYGEIIPDYQLGERQCALFLSLRYHNLNPDYIHERLKLLGNSYDLRVILVQVDIKHCKHNLKELGKIGLLAGCTLILTWSAEEAGRYLETYKQYENKPPNILQERVETDYFARIQDVLTTIKSINKTDAITLISKFGSLQNIINASKDEIVLCPGFGQQKAQRLHKVFHEPFKRTSINITTPKHSVVSCEAGQLPSTSKLKRPSENIYQLNKLKRNNSDSQMEVSTKSCSISTSPTSSLSTHKLEHPTLIVQKEVVLPSTSDKDDNIQTNTPLKEICDKLASPGNDNSCEGLELLDLPAQQKNIQQSSKTKTSSISYHKMSKSEAVYKSGLSRNRKETNTVSNYTFPHVEQSSTEPGKIQVSHDKKSDHIKNIISPSSRTVHKSNKIRTRTCNTGKTVSVSLDKSKSTTISLPSNLTPKKMVAAVDGASPSSKNRDLLSGKNGARTHRKSESTATTTNVSRESVSNYSTQMTNDEFMDLLADDLDQDDDDDII